MKKALQIFSHYFTQLSKQRVHPKHYYGSQHSDNDTSIKSAYMANIDRKNRTVF
ncbi:hypothetical protein HMPREF0201_00478 [Cedecea davisae DSM 4568]|uniref:Uncharacterized protein n=1 Tax=Cedecea davisae DSM 4568 TaxID=566551 RepID=S3J4D1_9ENTR|nr:hypothetical protein HMPREF0201_00478 [Cedecea davisae DSM 4568]